MQFSFRLYWHGRLIFWKLWFLKNCQKEFVFHHLLFNTLIFFYIQDNEMNSNVYSSMPTQMLRVCTSMFQKNYYQKSWEEIVRPAMFCMVSNLEWNFYLLIRSRHLSNFVSPAAIHVGTLLKREDAFLVNVFWDQNPFPKKIATESKPLEIIILIVSFNLIFGWQGNMWPMHGDGQIII